MDRRDPELQDAIEALLWAAGDRANCPMCHRPNRTGHTKACKIGKVHAVLNSRVERATQPQRGDDHAGD